MKKQKCDLFYVIRPALAFRICLQMFLGFPNKIEKISNFQF